MTSAAPDVSTVRCSRSVQADSVICEGTDRIRVEIREGTADVILGPDCPWHNAPMHRAPAIPKLVVYWVCHGYDGEGCTEVKRETL